MQSGTMFRGGGGGVDTGLKAKFQNCSSSTTCGQMCLLRNLVPWLQAQRHAESLDNAVWTNQFDNTFNRKAHFETTGPEIWRQTGKGGGWW